MNDPLSFHRSRTLPAISLNTQISQPQALVRYNGTPKRYEETKSVLVQDFSHRRILGIGNGLYSRSLELAENEKNQAIQFAESQVWVEAEKIKNEALLNARHAAQTELENTLKKVAKANDKQRKEEALQIELAMQKAARAQVQQERLSGEEKLGKAVKETKEKCHEELLKAVASAREEVLQQEAKKAATAERQHKEELKKALEKAEQDKNNSLQTLKRQKEIEQKEALAATTSRLKKISEEEITKVTKKYEETIAYLQSDIDEKRSKIDLLEEEIKKVEKQKSKLISCVLHTRDQFQMFIDGASGFDKGQSEFMIPSFHPDMLEKI